MSDQEAVKVGAVAVLRSALTSGTGVSGALRRCWYQNPLFSSALFTECMRQWFGHGCDIREITRFVTRVGSREPVACESLPAREAEALIRAALGETTFFKVVNPALFSYPEIGITVLDRLFQEWKPGAGEVMQLLSVAQEVADAVGEDSAELAARERDWFGARMHESPFVAWPDEMQDPRA